MSVRLAQFIPVFNYVAENARHEEVRFKDGLEHKTVMADIVLNGTPERFTATRVYKNGEETARILGAFQASNGAVIPLAI